MPAFASVGAELTYAGGRTAAAIPVPSGVTNLATDIVLVCLYTDDNPTITAPLDFVQAPDSPVVNTTSGQGFTWRVYWRRPSAADSGTYSFTWTGATGACGFALRLSGCVSTGNPFDVTVAAATSVAATTTPALSDTTTTDNDLVVVVGANYPGTNFALLSGFTEHFDSNGMVAQSKTQATAGATGSLSSSYVSSGSSTAWLGALKPTVLASLGSAFWGFFKLGPAPVARVASGDPEAPTLPGGRTARYVSPTGNDSNPGTISQPWLTMAKVATGSYTAGDQILFERGGTYYGTGLTETPTASGSNRLYIGAYGTGARPLLTNRKFCNLSAGWSLFSTNVWRINLTSASTHTGWTAGPSAGSSNTGHITVDGTTYGNKRQSTAALTTAWDFYDDGTYLYVRATANPTTLASNIIAAPDGRMIQVDSNTEVAGLSFANIGGHAISTNNVPCNNVSVHHNTVTNIGGSFLIGFGDNTVRYGNGIEAYGPASDWLVESNTVSQCYDAGITPQGGNAFSNIIYRGNTVSDCPYLFEFFQDSGATTCSGMVVENNTFTNGGYGWSSAWKAGIGEPRAVYVTWTNPQNSSSIEVRNNVVNTATMLVYGGASAASPWINYHNNDIRLVSGTLMRSGNAATINTAAAYATANSTESGSTFTVL